MFLFIYTCVIVIAYLCQELSASSVPTQTSEARVLVTAMTGASNSHRHDDLATHVRRTLANKKSIKILIEPRVFSPTGAQ